MFGEDLSKISDWAARRRGRLATLVQIDDTNREFIKAEKTEPVGLAFSGGGIRSATISLGVTQLLVRRNRFSAFDYVSTASGGGYFGSFLRSLFLPQSAKGRQSVKSEMSFDDAVQEQFYFAHKVLGAGPKKGEVPDTPKSERNPIWWLRENGRYLAPNGTTDYLMALSYIARNWSATLYVIALAMAGLAALLQLFLLGSVSLTSYVTGNRYSIEPGYFSPFLIAPIFCFVSSMGIGVGYWMTEGMRYNPNDDMDARRKFWATWSATGVAFIVAMYLAASLDFLRLLSVYHNLVASLPFLPASAAELVTGLPLLAKTLIYAGTFILGAALVSSFAVYFKDGAKVNPTSLLRRRLTRWSTVLNQIALWCLAVALIDTAALMLRENQLIWSPSKGVDGLWTLVIYPAIAFMIKKLPEWFSGSGSGISGWVGKHAGTAAIFGAVSLYASLAVLADLAVHMALWEGVAWSGEIDWATFLLFAAIIAGLVVMTGASSGFTNLSSLHALYSSRLTRAYLGASNRDRMRSSIEISDGHEKDFIDAQLYSEAKLPAPMHLINLTLNQTRGRNQLVRRDRKGQRFTVGPDGICVDGGLNSWKALNDEGAEPFSVGQLAAISGAAASSAMGRQTSLGAALGLTFANVRLGYWWDRGKKRLVTGDEVVTPKPPSIWLRPFETFIYLFNEMTSRFSLDYRHYYLSDGGHSENSGALELLRRKCKFILVSDNGQDEKFLFSDLEIFIRTARIDLGFEISVANHDDTIEYAGQRASHHFFNLDGADWRTKAAESGGKAFALLLTARPIGNKRAGLPPVRDDFVAHIIWLKPRIFAGISTDIASYAAQNAPFPHQTTIDQFFDEAQWESYRRLGYEMASCLFTSDANLPDVPVISLAVQNKKSA